jgi:hypothetical protein
MTVLFIYGSLNDTISSSGYTASSDRMIIEWWAREDVKLSGPAFVWADWGTQRES